MINEFIVPWYFCSSFWFVEIKILKFMAYDFPFNEFPSSLSLASSRRVLCYLLFYGRFFLPLLHCCLHSCQSRKKGSVCSCIASLIFISISIEPLLAADCRGVCVCCMRCVIVAVVINCLISLPWHILWLSEWVSIPRSPEGTKQDRAYCLHMHVRTFVKCRKTMGCNGLLVLGTSLFAMKSIPKSNQPSAIINCCRRSVVGKWISTVSHRIVHILEAFSSWLLAFYNR